MSIRRPVRCRSRFATVGLATVIACLAVGVAAGPADASILSPGKSVTLKDAIVTARCSMSVQSDSPTIAGASTVVTIPFSSPLLLCANAAVVLKDGTVHFLSPQCV